MIGNAGSATAEDIKINFSKIKLDARTSEGIPAIATTAYPTTCSIFTAATLLNKFEYYRNSFAVYKYTKAEDWGTGTDGTRYVTYGKEVGYSTSGVYSGEYPDKEMCYSGAFESDYTNPLSSSNPATDYYLTGFGSFLKYVATDYDGTKHQIEVNHGDKAFDGCGTYNHPYSISTDSDLIVISKIFQDIVPDTNWTIKIQTDTTNNGHKWCNHTANTASWECDSNVYYFNSTDSKFHLGSLTGSTTKSLGEIKEYLAGAYYSIDNNEGITLSSDFRDLGVINTGSSVKTNRKYIFHGVIVGNGNTITNKSNAPLINSSYGTVVKEVTLVVDPTNAIELSCSNRSEYSTSAGYINGSEAYGAVIGKVLGGDNIIDKTFVNFSDTVITIKDTSSGNTYPQLIATGGFVGVAERGSLIFRNYEEYRNTSGVVGLTNDNVNFVSRAGAAEENLILNEDETPNMRWLYVNPIVGRVLSCAVVTEGDAYRPFENGTRNGETATDTTYEKYSESVTMQNGTKNYSIADISSKISNKAFTVSFNKKLTQNLKLHTETVSQLQYDLTIYNSQNLYILSLLTQAGLTYNTPSKRSDYGITGYSIIPYHDPDNAKIKLPHTANYNDVGKESITNTNSDYIIAKNEETATDAKHIPYLIKNYTSGSSTASQTGNAYTYLAFSMTNKQVYLDIEFPQNTVLYMPDGFRGIGYSPFLTAPNADFLNDLQLHILELNGNNSRVSMNTSMYLYEKNFDNYSKESSYNSVGFLTTFAQNKFGIVSNNHTESFEQNTDYQIHDLTISGTVKSDIIKHSDAAGGSATSATDTANAFNAGGFAGTIYISESGSSRLPRKYNFNKVNLSNLTVYGIKYAGGLLGYAYMMANPNATDWNTTFTNVSPSGDQYSKINIFNCTTSGLKISSAGYAGGLIGYADYCQVRIDNANIQFNKIEVKPSGTDSAGAGALFGYADDTYYCDTSKNQKGICISHVTIGKSGTPCSYIGYKDKDSTNYQTAMSGQILSGGVIGKAIGEQINIDDCTVYDVDVYGNRTGGVIGQVTDSGTLLMNHIYITGSHLPKIYNDNNQADKNNNKYYNGSGGVIGETDGFKAITVNNGSVTGYNIEDKWFSGGIIGCCQSAGALSISNVKISECTLKADKNLGDIVGFLKACPLNGYNILTSNNTHALFDTDDGKKWGQIIGWNEGVNVKLVGYSRQGSSLEAAISNAAENAPVYGSNGYVVFADYNGTSRNPVKNLWDNSYITDVFSGTPPEGLNTYEEYNGFSEFNDDSNVSNNLYNSITVDSLPKYYTYPANFPYVTSMPTFTLFTKAIADGEPLAKKQFLTGDGIGANTSYAPIKNIILGIKNDSNKQYSYTYTTVNAIKSQDDDILNITNTITNSPGWELKSNFTTYYDAMEVNSKAYTNFPVLVVDTSNKTESTNLVNSYLRLLTNTNYDFTSDQSGIYSVVLNTVNYTAGTGFDITATGETATALHRDNGKFFITSTFYDSETDGQFTLIDVQFYDPTGTGEVAYHLYVPVLVKKMLRYNFDTEVLSGTTYLDQLYTQRAALETLGAPITVRVQFSYPEIDWQSMIDNGENLMWHFNKSIPISTTAGTTIDPETRVVLIDKNHGKATYYAKYSDVVQGNTIAFSRFTNYDPLEFGEFVLVEQTAAEVTVGEETIYYTNEYINLGSLAENNNVVPTGATCFDGTNYYRPKADTGDEGETIVHLKLKSTTAVEETYFLTFFTIATSSYVRTTDAVAATAIDDSGTMYRPYNSETDGNETVYELTFKGGKDANDLDYVDTVRVVNITLRYPATMTAANSSGTALVVPNQVRDWHNSNIVIGNLYNQVLTFITTNGQNEHKMSYPEHHDIDVTMIAEITINDGGSSATKNTLTSYFSTVDVYQSFVVYADNVSYDETLMREVHSKTFEGSPTVTIDTLKISNLDDTGETPINSYQINPHYSETQTNQLINGTSYFEILPQGSAYKLDDKLKGDGAKVTAEFTISYNSAASIALQFPERYNNQLRYGFELSGTSNLSGDMTSKAYSATQTPQKTDNIRYYCEKNTFASLSYDIPANDSGKEIGLSGEAYDYNQLGINPADSTSQTNDIIHIDAKGFYNLADLPSVAEATRVEWTLELQVKGEDGNYHPVNNMSDYFKTDATHKVSGKSEANSTDETFDFTLQTKEVTEGGERVFREYYYKSQEITNHNARGFVIETSYDIITGSAFETDGFKYSNYQIVLTATLVKPKKVNGVVVQDEEEQDTNSIASDYIIYTNARILTEYVKKPTN